MKLIYILSTAALMFSYTLAMGQASVTLEQQKKDSLRRAEDDYRLRNDWANLKRFESENNQLGLPRKGEYRVVLMGNSITQGWSDMDPGFFKGRSFINRGIGGQTTGQMLLRFRPDVINLSPKVVVILAGTNDIAGNNGPTSEEAIIGNIQSMALLAKHYGIKVILSSILPVYDYPWKKGLNPVPKIHFINTQLSKFAQENKMIYLDYFTPMADQKKGLQSSLTYDGVHPNLAGYKVMEPLLESAVRAAMKK